ncbi:MAG: sensor histidine kinase [Anaerolineales bacterium]|jgi:signal transduction histidine kinase
MSNETLIIVYFSYGLSFFTMGLAVFLELGRGPSTRLRHALQPLAAFALLHATHEWIEMFQLSGILSEGNFPSLLAESLRIAFLSFSFLSLAAFGSYLLAPEGQPQRISMLVPLAMAAIWGFGALILSNQFRGSYTLWSVVDVWTRYTLGIPAAVLASVGLIAQQRVFRQAGLSSFGRDSLWAAVAFLWYGLVGQFFTSYSPLFPSNVINSELFLDIFGFPIQLLRAAAAGVAAIFIIRVLRAFDYETRRQIEILQKSRLEEAERRETLQRTLFKRVVDAQEAERQRIARELHDETGQSLTALGLGLRSVSNLLTRDPDKAQNNIRQLENTSNHALTELQRLIADLRPSHLDDFGLPATLRWYANDIEQRIPLKVAVHIEGEPQPLSPQANTTVFRIFQEALTNIIKHAEAEQVTVKMQYLPDQVVLEVRDDGKGFNPAIRANPARPTWGLTGMEERAALLDGSLRVFSVTGEGTLVELHIPYQDNLFESSKGNGHADTPTARG